MFKTISNSIQCRAHLLQAWCEASLMLIANSQSKQSALKWRLLNGFETELERIWFESDSNENSSVQWASIREKFQPSSRSRRVKSIQIEGDLKLFRRTAFFSRIFSPEVLSEVVLFAPIRSGSCLRKQCYQSIEPRHGSVKIWSIPFQFEPLRILSTQRAWWELFKDRKVFISTFHSFAQMNGFHSSWMIQRRSPRKNWCSDLKREREWEKEITLKNDKLAGI